MATLYEALKVSHSTLSRVLGDIEADRQREVAAKFAASGGLAGLLSDR